MTDSNIVDFPTSYQPNQVITASECAELDFEPWTTDTCSVATLRARIDEVWPVLVYSRAIMMKTKPELCAAIEEAERIGGLDKMSAAFDAARETLTVFVAMIDDATARTVIAAGTIENAREIGPHVTA